MLLSFPEFLKTDVESGQRVWESTEFMLGLLQQNGNIAPAMDEVVHPRPEEEELVHWCHGAPGWLMGSNIGCPWHFYFHGTWMFVVERDFILCPSPWGKCITIAGASLVSIEEIYIFKKNVGKHAGKHAGEHAGEHARQHADGMKYNR